VFSVRLFKNIITFDLSFFGFILMLIFCILLFPNLKKYYNPILCSKMFLIGLFLGFISEQFFRKKPNLNVFLSLNTYAPNQIRIGGLLNDPNFLALQSIMCLCLVINVFKSIDNKKDKHLILALSILVTIITFLTASKMYFLCLLIIILYYIIKFLIKLKIKNLLFFLILLSISITVSYHLGFLNGIISRLNEVNNLDTLTTSRSYIAKLYIDMLYNNNKILFFGVGLYDRLYYFGRSTHNTILSGFYQLGIFGFIFIYIPLILDLFNSILKQKTYRLNNIAFFVLLICSISLDILMYEGLPIYIIISIAGINKINEVKNEKGICNSSSL